MESNKESLQSRFDEILQQAVNIHASDIHINAYQKIYFRKDGEMQLQSYKCFDESEMKEFFLFTAGNTREKALYRDGAVDFSWHHLGQRYRINIFLQQGGLALAMRLIPREIPRLTDLGLDESLNQFLNMNQGLVIITGKTGTGKSTTLAAMLQEIMDKAPKHLVTLEDPIEFIFKKSSGIISQREYGRDFYSFPKALEHAMREAPDVIMVGEIRDSDTLITALEAAETGHLVLGTLHTGGAAQAVERMESLVPMDSREQLRQQVAMCLQGVVSQQLLPKKDGGRVCAAEVLRATSAVRNIIRSGRYIQLESQMLAGSSQGMCRMDEAVKRLQQKGVI